MDTTCCCGPPACAAGLSADTPSGEGKGCNEFERGMPDIPGAYTKDKAISLQLERAAYKIVAFPHLWHNPNKTRKS